MKGDVYVKFDPGGRLGNRMFQLAFGVILSHLRGCELYHDEIPNFGISKNIKNPIEPLLPTRSMGLQKVDLEKLIQTESSIVVDSFVQRAEYYIDYRNELKQFFNIETVTPINPNKLILHVRETDYTQINTFLGLEKYKQLIKQTGYVYNDVIIVTDNSNCSTVINLLDCGCQLNTEGCVSEFAYVCDNRGMSDFNTLLNSENIAISQSSFSWWAAFLGDHNSIYFPYTSDTAMWPAHPVGDAIDLFFETDKCFKIHL